MKEIDHTMNSERRVWLTAVSFEGNDNHLPRSAFLPHLVQSADCYLGLVDWRGGRDSLSSESDRNNTIYYCAYVVYILSVLGAGCKYCMTILYDCKMLSGH